MTHASKTQDTDASGAGRTHFGYAEVESTEKGALVQDLFEKVAGNYDLMNDLMSGGIHRVWKDMMIDWLHPRAGMSLLDVAGGTGDVAFRVLKKLQDKPGAPANVTVCDFTHGMLKVGRDRAIDQGLLNGLEWTCGDAQALPFPDQHFDAYTIAFGIRNVTDLDKALREAYRVLKPGGRFLCLEFSTVSAPVIDQIYNFYSFEVIPRIGQMVSKDRDSYQYLVESIRQFPDADAFADKITAAGFDNVKVRTLIGGVAAIHSGWRI